MAVSPARAAAFDILLRVEQQDAYASELLHSSRFAKLSPQDHGLTTELVMGVLRWRSLLDTEHCLRVIPEAGKTGPRSSDCVATGRVPTDVPRTCAGSSGRQRKCRISEARPQTFCSAVCECRAAENSRTKPRRLKRTLIPRLQWWRGSVALPKTWVRVKLKLRRQRLRRNCHTHQHIHFGWLNVGLSNLVTRWQSRSAFTTSKCLRVQSICMEKMN